MKITTGQRISCQWPYTDCRTKGKIPLIIVGPGPDPEENRPGPQHCSGIIVIKEILTFLAISFIISNVFTDTYR